MPQNKKVRYCKMTLASNVNVTVAHRYGVRQPVDQKITRKEEKRITLDTRAKIMIGFLYTSDEKNSLPKYCDALFNFMRPRNSIPNSYTLTFSVFEIVKI